MQIIKTNILSNNNNDDNITILLVHFQLSFIRNKTVFVKCSILK